MKWFSHDSNAYRNPDMELLIDKWGWDWYGRWWVIVEMVAERVEYDNQSFALQTNNGNPITVKRLSRNLGTNATRLEAFCGFLADNNLIDAELWNTKKLVRIPKLAKRSDEYTKRVRRKSGQEPDNIRAIREDRTLEDKRRKKEREAEFHSVENPAAERVPRRGELVPLGTVLAEALKDLPSGV